MVSDGDFLTWTMHVPPAVLQYKKHSEFQNNPEIQIIGEIFKCQFQEHYAGQLCPWPPCVTSELRSIWSVLFLPTRCVTSGKLLNLSVLGFLSHEMEH